MAFDLGSFLLGWGAGVVSGPVMRRMRPLFVELAAAMGQMAENATIGVAQQGERLQDLFADARDAFQRSRVSTAARASSAPEVEITDEPAAEPAPRRRGSATKRRSNAARTRTRRAARSGATA